MSATLLDEWLAPQWRDPAQARARALYVGPPRFAIADGILRPAKLKVLKELVAALPMELDYPDLNYDAHARRIDQELSAHGLEFFGSAEWHEWLAELVRVNLLNLGHTVIRARRHYPGSRGFWIHTDRDPHRPKRLAALLYLNDHWCEGDGGVLQVWRTRAVTSSEVPCLQYADYIGKELDFLVDASQINIHAGAEEGLERVEAILEANIAPIANRLVVLDFVNDPCYHSVTPSNSLRKGLVQWLY